MHNCQHVHNQYQSQFSLPSLEAIDYRLFGLDWHEAHSPVSSGR